VAIRAWRSAQASDHRSIAVTPVPPTIASAPSLSTAARYDVMFMDEPWIAPLAEFLLPLTERARGYDMTDFVPTALAAGAFQGVQ